MGELTRLNVAGFDDIRASTLHSYCFQLLSKAQVFEYLGRIARPLIVVNKSGTLQFEGAPLLEDLGQRYGSKRARVKRVRAYEAAWARDQHQTPGWAFDPADQQFEDDLVNWLRFHQAILIGELVPKALQYLRNNPVCPDMTSFDHIIVDEYQDLNKAEQVLIDLLARNGRLMIVGDPDQSIYSFRFAWPDGIVEFPVAHPNTHDETLVECRHCPRRVVALANALIRGNYGVDGPTRLEPSPEKGEGEVHIIQWQSIEEEAQGIGHYVRHLVEDQEYKPGDILILTPRRFIGQLIRRVLTDLEVPTHSFYHEESLEQPDAQRAFTLLTLLANRKDRVALRFWLGLDSPTWNRSEYEVLRAYSTQSGEHPWAVLEKVLNGDLSFPHTKRITARFEELLTALQQLEGLSGEEFVNGLFPEDQPWAETLRDAALTSVEEGTAPGDLFAALRSQITQPEIPDSADFVRIMSLHKSKGLKSRVVVVAGCIEGLAPTLDTEDKTSHEIEQDLMEQRRLFYVAVTRATETLVLSSLAQIEPCLIC